MFLSVSSIHVVPAALPSAQGPDNRRRKGNRSLSFDAFVSLMAPCPDLVESAAVSR